MVVACVLVAPVLFAQSDEPRTPESERLPQDEFDLQGRLNVVLGAGARAYGMGAAFLARADDATAASWNPAGLSYLLRPELSIVGARFDIDSNSGARESSQYSGHGVDFAAATFPLPGIAGSAQISYQRMIPFSGKRTIQREQGPTELTAEGGFDVVALGTGWKVSSSLRTGVTLNHWTNGFHQVLNRPITELKSSRQEVYFDINGWNLNLGLIWSPRETLNVGVVAKTPFTGAVRLTRRRRDTFSQVGEDPTEVTTENSAWSNTVVLRFPQAYGAGLSWRPMSSLTLSADYTYTFWSEATISDFFVLKSTPPVPADAKEPAPEYNASLPYPLLIAAQSDAAQIRGGAEYVIIHNRFKCPIRAGLFLDRQFFQDENGKAPQFRGVTAGTGLVLGSFSLDVAFLHETGTYADAGLGPTHTRTNRVLFSAIYRHGGLR